MKTLIGLLLALVASASAQGLERFYEPVPVTLPETFMSQDYTLPLDLDLVSNLDLFDLGDEEKALLEEHGFVVVPAGWLEFYQLYERNSYPIERPAREGRVAYEGYAPMFITSDAVYHAYHLVFSKLLRDLERRELAPTLTRLTDALVEEAVAGLEAVNGEASEEAAALVLAYLSVAQALLHETPPEVPALIRELVESELALIHAYEAFTLSPLLGSSRGCREDYREDYSQYTPRGHYTTREDLSRYFRAMMWYGRINLRLCSPLETQMALILTDLMRATSVDGVPAERVWASIYDPTAFLVGHSDDLGFRDYAPLRDEVFGAEARWDAFLDEDSLQAFGEAARTLPRPRINSLSLTVTSEEERQEDKTEETQGFRFMGQRFVLDAYIFEELTFRQVGTLEHPRNLPRALDVFAAQGSEEALAILEEMGETSYESYLEQLAKMQGELAGLMLDDWTGTLYSAWLYSLQAFLNEKDVRFPTFMQTQAWTRKDLQTALGSFTQLKHDTILYAKQVMAQRGGGPYDIPGGYVEPNPEAFARLLALVRMTRLGLEAAGLLTPYDLDLTDPDSYPSYVIPYEDVTARNLADLESMLIFLVSAAERHLRGETLDESDYSRILFFGGWLEDMTLRSSDNLDDPDLPATAFTGDEQAAITADIATSPFGDVLQEAIGRVNEIYVVVPEVTLRARDTYIPGESEFETVATGRFQVAKGGVFSYYEFIREPGARLDNETWRAILEAGEAPPQPEWTALFTAPALPAVGSYPWTAQREVRFEELERYSCEELRLMRNEIFARYGYVFAAEDLREHFSAQAWYSPADDAGTANEQVGASLRVLERDNARLIQMVEQSIGCD